ncbi:hypothetical protein [Bauldia sp.]
MTAVADGFTDFDALARFWRDVHGTGIAVPFLIGWGKPYLDALEDAA